MSAYSKVQAHLNPIADRLGVPRPVEFAPELMRRSFSLPLGPEYGRNHLCPGLFPLELSFSEGTPGILRLGLDVAGPRADAQFRLKITEDVVRALLLSVDASAPARFGALATPFKDLGSRPLDYGAGIGLGIGPTGIIEVKAYYETDLHTYQGLSESLRVATQRVASLVGYVAPRFTSVSMGVAGGGVRLYLLCGEAQTTERLSRMLRVMCPDGSAKWVSDRLIALFGQLPLPVGSVMIALKQAPGEPLEIRVLVMTPAIRKPPPDLFFRVYDCLSDRPQSQQRLREWVRDFTVLDNQSPGAITVVSMRCAEGSNPRLSLYFNPAGFGLKTSAT